MEEEERDVNFGDFVSVKQEEVKAQRIEEIGVDLLTVFEKHKVSPQEALVVLNNMIVSVQEAFDIRVLTITDLNGNDQKAK